MSSYTELDAVNQILAAQGFPPVATVEGDTSKNTQIALNALRETSRQVQLEAWTWNTFWDYALQVESDTGEIAVPDAVIRFLIFEEPWVVPRGPRMYDKSRQSFIFTQAVKGKAVLNLAWEEIPLEAQNYIALRSARKTYESFVGADETRQNLYVEEREARRALEELEAAEGQHSMLDDPFLPYFRGSEYVPGSPRLPRF